MPITIRGGKVGLFVHLPKTAGTTLEHFLKQWTRLSFLNQSPKQYLKTSPQHMILKDIELFFDPNFFDFSFSVVRHPLERIKSEYYGHHGSVDDSLEKIEKWWYSSVDLFSQNNNIYDNHFRPQSDFLESNKQFDVKVFRLEDGIIPVYEYISKNLYIPCSTIPKSQRMNKSKKPSSVDWGGIEKNILEFYSEDIERFYSE